MSRFDTLQDHEFRRDEWAARERESKAPIDFSCRVCGAICDSAPDPPARLESASLTRS